MGSYKCLTIECYNNSECNDSDELTSEKCINPATTDSYCEYKWANYEFEITDSPITISLHKEQWGIGENDLGTRRVRLYIYEFSDNAIKTFVEYNGTHYNNTMLYLSRETEIEYPLNLTVTSINKGAETASINIK